MLFWKMKQFFKMQKKIMETGCPVATLVLYSNMGNYENVDNMPYQLLKTKNNRRKIIYIMTPVLFFFINRLLFCKELSDVLCGNGISIIALIWIIWFQSKGKKFENNVHEFVWNKSRYNKVEIDVQGIKLEDKKICELKEIDRVFFCTKVFFFS